MAQVNLVEMVGGLGFIEKFVLENHTKNMEEINEVRAKIAELSETAQAALFSQFRGNIYIGISNTLKDDDVIKDLNERVWRKFLQAIRPLISTATDHLITERQFRDNFTKETRPSVESITEMLKNYEEVEAVALSAKEIKNRIEAISDFFELEKTKLKSGSLDEKIQITADYADLIVKATNISRPRHHTKETIENITALQIKVADIATQHQGTEVEVNALVSLKVFANGNFDIKVKNTRSIAIFF